MLPGVCWGFLTPYRGSRGVRCGRLGSVMRIVTVVAVTMLVVGCGSSGAWSPEKKAELVEACTESPALEEMSDLLKAVVSELAEDYGVTVEDLLEQRDELFRSDPARCECVISVFEKEMTLEEFDSLGYAGLERLTVKAENVCL